MKIIIAIILAATTAWSSGKTIKFNFKNEELTKIVELYAKETGQKFIISAGVRGLATIINTDEVTTEEAFNQLSSALATQGYAISKQGDNMIIQTARTVQRSLIEVTSEVPSLKPERMATWILSLKHISAESVLRDMRNTTSRDGEISVLAPTNQLMITDWTSNLQRFAEVMKVVDTPIDQKLKKFVEQNNRQIEERKRAKKAEQKGEKLSE